MGGYYRRAVACVNNKIDLFFAFFQNNQHFTPQHKLLI